MNLSLPDRVSIRRLRNVDNRCYDYPFDLYLDYRFLPENVLPFGRRSAEAQAAASETLAAAAGTLARSVPADARRKVLATGMSEKVYYLANLNGYLKGEFERKPKTYTNGSKAKRG
jgi:hypothetical protein